MVFGWSKFKKLPLKIGFFKIHKKMVERAPNKSYIYFD